MPSLKYRLIRTFLKVLPVKRILSAPPEKLIKVARKLNATKGKGFQIPKDPEFSYADLIVETAGEQWHCLRIRHGIGDFDVFVSPEAKVASADPVMITPNDSEIVSRETINLRPSSEPKSHENDRTRDTLNEPEANHPDIPAEQSRPSESRIVSRETFTGTAISSPGNHEHTNIPNVSEAPKPDTLEAPHERPNTNEAEIVSRETFADTTGIVPKSYEHTGTNHPSDEPIPKSSRPHQEPSLFSQPRIVSRETLTSKPTPGFNDHQNPCVQDASDVIKPDNPTVHRKRPKANESEIVSRETFTDGRDSAQRTATVDSVDQQINGVKPTFSEASDKALLFIYGGGMVSEADMTDIGPAMRFAEDTQREVWFPFYPLCLDYSAMTSLEMVYGCYREMLKLWLPQDICVLGYSSGAGLALALCHLLREQRDPQPEKLILFSPGSITDDEAWHQRARHLARKDVLVDYQFLGSIRTIMEHGEQLPEWFLNPWSGGFEGFPRCHFWFGGDELFAASIPNFESACREAGVPYTVTVGDRMCHCYPFIPGPDFPEKQAALRQITAQIIGS